MTSTYLLDANVLLALYDPRHVHHVGARRWFEGVDEWATTPITEAAFVRLVGDPAVSGAGASPREAIVALDAIRHAPGHRFLIDDSSLGRSHIDLGSLISVRQVTDFHLLNLAVRAGLIFATFDARFTRSLAPDDRPFAALILV